MFKDFIKYIPKINIDFLIFILLCIFAASIPMNSITDGIFFLLLILWFIKLCKGKLRWQKNILTLSSILLIIAFTISFFLNFNKYSTSLLETNIEAIQFFLGIIAPLLFFLVISSIPISDEKLDKIIYVFLLAMSVLIIYYFINNFNNIVIKGRLSICNINPNRSGALAAMLGIMIFVLISLEKNKLKIGLYGILLFPALIGLFFTFSRGAWIGFTLSIVFLTFFILKNRIIQLLALLVSVLSATIFLFIPALMERFYSIFSITHYTNYSRLYIWKLSLTKMAFISPIFGIGPGLYRTFFVKLNQNPQIHEKIPHAHNNFLQILVEGGIIGLLAFIILFFGLFFLAYKIKREALNSIQYNLSIVLIGWLIYWTTQGLIDFTFGYRQIMYLLFLIFALLFSNKQYNKLDKEH